MIRAGWPGEKRYVPPAVQPCWDHRDNLVVEGQLIFKGHRIVIPACLRKDLMAFTYASHVVIEGCVRHAREACDVCLAHQASQQKEPLTQHEVIMRPWAKLAVDLCALHGRTLLVVADYISNYIVESLTSDITERDTCVVITLRQTRDPRCAII